tara:strand:+ start:578 stop:799 length:222 start_codon:yes stop_codon:yes gene_type:complete
MKIENETFKQVVSEIACQITTEKFGDNTCVAIQDENSGMEYFEYTEDAQEFFNSRYDEIEHLLLTQFKIKLNY